jgi:hypothetical protein
VSFCVFSWVKVFEAALAENNQFDGFAEGQLVY